MALSIRTSLPLDHFADMPPELLATYLAVLEDEASERK